jgi:hypothetical protein
MRTRLLLLAPMLVSIAGSSEKTEALESSSGLGEIGMPPEKTDETANAPEEKMPISSSALPLASIDKGPVGTGRRDITI